jgi:hypothetical protein
MSATMAKRPDKKIVSKNRTVYDTEGFNAAVGSIPTSFSDSANSPCMSLNAFG